LFMYLWLALFTLIGGVLRERRDDLGLDADLEPEPGPEDGKQREQERARLIDRIYAQWRGGAQHNALQTIAAQLGSAADPMAELQWLYESIAQWPDPRLANRLAQQLLPQLLAARRNGEALDIARARLKTDGNFRPESGETTLRLALLARDAGDRPVARTLLSDFDQRYPRDPALTAAISLREQLER
ncbi:MAG TPA: hypothetical protein VKB34_15840, partial [Povalibacter sp.]|nr:hypothetical protein [Povalibacter sp.]